MIIETERTKCRDCYKCLRACPVKAIRVSRGRLPQEMHATVVEDYCILDGTCLRECPQGAKRIRDESPMVKAMIRGGERVAVSLAPSFAASLPLDDPLRIVTALRRLGFSVVEETALGAEMVTQAHQRLFDQSDRPLISSACPAVVSLVEKHYPEAIPYLAPLVSPAVAHGKYLKREYPGIRVVFIGPCVAKKDEIGQPSVLGAVDVALTFQEILNWLRVEGIDPAECPPGEFDGPHPNVARLFAADGGLLRTMGRDGVLEDETVVVSGITNCIEMIEHFLAGDDLPGLVELLACPGGCISGPFSLSKDGLFDRRAKLLAYAQGRKGGRRREASFSAVPDAEATDRLAPGSKGCDVNAPDYEAMLPFEDLLRTYRNRKVPLLQPSETEIAEILEKTGKYTREDELNCGACGYNSCREKAQAVYNGMADPEMCIPYMRERAESMANLVVESTPNGIVLTSRGGTIFSLNQAAERILGQARRNCVGQPIEMFIDASLFHDAAKREREACGEVTVNGLAVEVEVLYVAGERMLLGLLKDVTGDRAEAERLAKVTEEAASRAQTVIEKQMAVVQKIAGLLGETTAETKISLTELMKVVREGKPASNGSKGGSSGIAT